MCQLKASLSWHARYREEKKELKKKKLWGKQNDALISVSALGWGGRGEDVSQPSA